MLQKILKKFGFNANTGLRAYAMLNEEEYRQFQRDFPMQYRMQKIYKIGVYGKNARQLADLLDNKDHLSDRERRELEYYDRKQERKELSGS